MELIRVIMGKSLFYYVYILLCIGLFLGLYFGFRKKDKKTQNMVLMIFLWGNFALHFIKLGFPNYVAKGFPEVLRKSSFENICAVSTLIFPFIYMSKRTKALKDYMFYLGAISGIAGCVAPFPVSTEVWNGAAGLPFYHPDTIRYYLCHAGIWIVPILMVLFGLHKLDYRRIWKVICIYFAVLGVIIVNELILIRIGWVDMPLTMEDFLRNASGRDLGYALGPTSALEGALQAVLWLTPKAWKDPYVPILWEFFPVVILGGLIMFAVSMIWEKEHFKADCVVLKANVLDKVAKFKAWKAEKFPSKNSALQNPNQKSTAETVENEPVTPIGDTTDTEEKNND